MDDDSKSLAYAFIIFGDAIRTVVHPRPRPIEMTMLTMLSDALEKKLPPKYRVILLKVRPLSLCFNPVFTPSRIWVSVYGFGAGYVIFELHLHCMLHAFAWFRCALLVIF